MMSSGVFIRNTFVELEDVEKETREKAVRSMSVPTFARLSAQGLSKEQKQESADDVHKQDSASTSEDEDLSTKNNSEVEVPETFDVCSFCTFSSDCQQQCKFTTPMCQHIASSDNDDDNDGGASDVVSEVSTIYPSDSVSNVGSGQSRQARRLETAGAEIFRSVAAAIVLAMQASGLVLEATLSQAQFGWQVVAKMPREALGVHKDFLLTVAKEAALQAAADSEATYVLGYGHQPFMTSPMGFSALLGYVADHSQACWDTLKYGSCYYGANCHWKHPDLRATLNVVVVSPGTEDEKLAAA
eukprot:TRINITY_DN65476_c0_g1_i1.p1 TRINITY_DN65476_c0_g1~~TRINITY_DN65476_c0_g1_i1.p1  ORF type:complete len:300 (-),score=70.18 TRINITY_DN65476_c0_g1_i1:195-1094(-)